MHRLRRAAANACRVPAAARAADYIDSDCMLPGYDARARMQDRKDRTHTTSIYIHIIMSMRVREHEDRIWVLSWILSGLAVLRTTDRGRRPKRTE